MDYVKTLFYIFVVILFSYSCIIWGEVFKLTLTSQITHHKNFVELDERIKKAIKFHGILPKELIVWSKERQEYIFIRNGQECPLLKYEEN